MTNKKNVLLIDRSEDVIESIVMSIDTNISVLIVATDRQRDSVRQKYKNIGKIFTIVEAQQCSNLEICYDDLSKYRETQLKVCNSMFRQSSDLNLITYVYYQALSFWINIFRENIIDIVVISEIELGTPYINIPADIARARNIPVFMLDPILNNGRSLLGKAINFYNNKKYIDVSEIRGYLPRIDINNFLFNSVAVSKNKEKKRLKDSLKQYAFTPWGMAMLAFMSFFTNRFDLNLNGFKIKWRELFLNTILLKKLLNMYESYSESQKNENYIFYAMHFEPEASIMTRVPLNSQLLIIKMLHDALPNGWKLYIKEHPHQFSLSNETKWYQLKNIGFFRSREFYKEIKKLSNVRFMPFKMQSKELIKNAKILASINGTITIEAIKYKKPIFLFGHLSNPFGYAEDVFKVTCTQDIVDGITKVENGFLPLFNDFDELLEKYIFETELSGKIHWDACVWEYLFKLKID